MKRLLLLTVLAMIACTGVALAQSAVMALDAPGPSATVIDLTAIINSLIAAVFSVVISVVGLYIQKHVKDANSAAVIESAVKNSLGALQQAVSNGVTTLDPRFQLPAKLQSFTPAVSYVLTHVPDALTRLGVTPEMVAQKVEAQLGLQSIAHNLAITASASSPETPAPLAPTRPHLLHPVQQA